MSAQVVTLSCKADVQVDWKCSSGQLVYLDQIVASYGTLAAKNEGKLVAPATGFITILPLSATESNEKEIQVATIDICMHPIIQNQRCVVCLLKVEQETVKVILPQGRIMEVNQATAKELDGESIERMLRLKKLMLVLDLDHTLLHAARTHEVIGDIDDEAIRFYIPNIPTEHVLKLRPGLSTFLSELSTLYDLHIYTHGTRSYAERITEIIDPDSSLFHHRIVARTDTPDVCHKSLKLLFPSCDDSMIVVLDDRVDVWKENADNVFIIEAFHYFNTRAEINNASGGPGKAEVKERKPDNHLTKALRILKLVHEKFYQGTNDGSRNVKYIMEKMRHNVLRGCNIVFSGVIPIDIPPENDYLWKLATSFGARPSMTLENFPITHLVIHPKRLGTKKYLEALKMPNVNVVSPQWLIDCASEWMRLREDRYRIRTIAASPKTEEEKDGGEETKEVDGKESASDLSKVNDSNQEESKQDSNITPIVSSARPPPAKGILVKGEKAEEEKKSVVFATLPEKIDAPFTTAMRRKPTAMTHAPVPAAPAVPFRPEVVAKGVVATGGSFDFLSKITKRASAPVVKRAPVQPVKAKPQATIEREPDIDDIFARLERAEESKATTDLKRKLERPPPEAKKSGKQSESDTPTAKDDDEEVDYKEDDSDDDDDKDDSNDEFDEEDEEFLKTMRGMNVMLRIRPPDNEEQTWLLNNEESLRTFDGAVVKDANNIIWAKHGIVKQVKVNAIFDASASQSTVFSSVQDLVNVFFEGHDCMDSKAVGRPTVRKLHRAGFKCLVAMYGNGAIENADDDTLLDEHAGILPRIVDNIFKRIEGDAYTMSCSCYEIVNEKVYDLLSSGNSTSPRRQLSRSHRRRLLWNAMKKQAHDSDGLLLLQQSDNSVLIEGLSRHQAIISSDVFALYQTATRHSTKCGHLLFELSMTQVATQKTLRFCFVDLCGLETGNDTPEAAAVHKSLSNLAQCVHLLSKKQRNGSPSHIPYRASALTRLLQPFLQADTRTAFLLTLSPALENFDTACSTLRFAERLKCIVCPPKVIQEQILLEAPERAEYEAQIASMQMEISRLQSDVETSKMHLEQSVEREQALLHENEILRHHIRASESILRKARALLTKDNQVETTSMQGEEDWEINTEPEPPQERRLNVIPIESLSANMQKQLVTIPSPLRYQKRHTSATKRRIEEPANHLPCIPQAPKQTAKARPVSTTRRKEDEIQATERVQLPKLQPKRPTALEKMKFEVLVDDESKEFLHIDDYKKKRQSHLESMLE